MTMLRRSLLESDVRSVAAMMATVRIRPRSAQAWLVIAVRTLAAVLWLIAAGTLHRPLFAFAIAGVGLVLVLATFRRKAPTAPGALYTAAADLLADDGRKLPGQLSLTMSALTWVPSRYSVRRHGQQVVSVEVLGCKEISLQRGYGLIDVILTVVRTDGVTLRFGTHTSRRLARTLDSFEGRAAEQSV